MTTKQVKKEVQALLDEIKFIRGTEPISNSRNKRISEIQKEIELLLNLNK